jgi:protein-S-isoprenylcysteine O-methyltransferase Ste14
VIPPFALLYLYLVFAAAFGLPSFSTQRLFDSEVLAWLGVLCRIGGMTLMLWSLVSFGRSFRVGIDVEHPDRLVTTGVFAYSRNPIYVAFASVLIGEFLIFPSWILLVCLVAGIWMFNRQILREEVYLASHYGQEYADYRARVRRYL